MPNSYKPSPLGYSSHGSPRLSPFRRPQTPTSPTCDREVGPIPSPLRPTSATESRMMRAKTAPTDAMTSPSKKISSAHTLSQLQASQARTLREGFQILDRDSDGVVNREDIADMLKQLGLPAGASDVAKFFPPSSPQNMPLAAFLNSLSTSLAALSPGPELLSAFSAFDDEDSGQIDLAELQDAILNMAPESDDRALTAPELDRVLSGFTGRRALSRSKAGSLGKRGEVFRYHDFVNSVLGSNGAAGQAAEDPDEI